MGKRIEFGAICFLLGLALPCQADLVTASGAGPLPASAEDLSSDRALTEITGAIGDPLGVDTFLIDILNFRDFSALAIPTGGFGIPDTELFLFNVGGLGVYGNDDISPSNTLSCLPARNAASNQCPATSFGAGPSSDGLYYLAITRSANSPLDANGADVFSSGASTGILSPNPQAGPVGQYDGAVFSNPDFDLVNYDIVLTGTSPEPGTWAFTISAAGLLLTMRKFLRSRR